MPFIVLSVVDHIFSHVESSFHRVTTLVGHTSENWIRSICSIHCKLHYSFFNYVFQLSYRFYSFINSTDQQPWTSFDCIKPPLIEAFYCNTQVCFVNSFRAHEAVQYRGNPRPAERNLHVFCIPGAVAWKSLRHFGHVRQTDLDVLHLIRRPTARHQRIHRCRQPAEGAQRCFVRSTHGWANRPQLVVPEVHMTPPCTMPFIP